MKWQDITIVVLAIGLGVFATLYFVHPRIVYIEKPGVPTTSPSVPTPPDTSYQVEIRKLRKIINDLRSDLLLVPKGTLSVTGEDSTGVPRFVDPDTSKMVISEKTFSHVTPMGEMKSLVRSYTHDKPAVALSDSLYFPNGEAAALKDLEASIRAGIKTNSKFLLGCVVGVVTVSAVVVTAIILTH
jgi:hypothetical protein